MRTFFATWLVLASIACGSSDPLLPSDKTPIVPESPVLGTLVTISNGEGQVVYQEWAMAPDLTAKLVEWDMSEADSMEAVWLMYHHIANPSTPTDTTALMWSYMGGDTTQVRVGSRLLSQKATVADWRLVGDSTWLTADVTVADTLKATLRTANNVILSVAAAIPESGSNLRASGFFSAPHLGMMRTVFSCEVAWAVYAGTLAALSYAIKTAPVGGPYAAVVGATMGATAALANLAEQGCLTQLKEWVADHLPESSGRRFGGCWGTSYLRSADNRDFKGALVRC